jgi:hypothetical protein
MSLLSLSWTGASRSLNGKSGPLIEPLEERQFFSAAAPLAKLDVPVKTQTEVFANKIARKGVTTLLGLTITGVELVGNQLFAVGTIGDTTFRTALTVTATPNPAQPSCPVLHLQLAAINLDLEGVNVSTSQICIDITTDPASPTPFGNLLCTVATQLLGQFPIPPLPLPTVINNLTPAQRTLLFTGVSDLLNGVLIALTSPSAATGISGSITGQDCDTLDLSLEAQDMTINGLNVSVDNCANGPVTLAITTDEDSGRLHDLFCKAARHFNNRSNPAALANFLARIASSIGEMV